MNTRAEKILAIRSALEMHESGAINEQMALRLIAEIATGMAADDRNGAHRERAKFAGRWFKEMPTEQRAFNRGDRITHPREGVGTVYQDYSGLSTVYVEFDSRKGVAQSVDPRDVERI